LRSTGRSACTAASAKWGRPRGGGGIDHQARARFGAPTSHATAARERPGDGDDETVRCGNTTTGRDAARSRHDDLLEPTDEDPEQQIEEQRREERQVDLAAQRRPRARQRRDPRTSPAILPHRTAIGRGCASNGSGHGPAIPGVHRGDGNAIAGHPTGRSCRCWPSSTGLHVLRGPRAAPDAGASPSRAPLGLPGGIPGAWRCRRRQVPDRGADLFVGHLRFGRTLAALKARLGAAAPANRIAVLLDKPSRREARSVPPVGFSVPDRWVVGYGLDFEGLYRNLPYISYIL
jgi:hypothetical protein